MMEHSCGWIPPPSAPTPFCPRGILCSETLFLCLYHAFLFPCSERVRESQRAASHPWPSIRVQRGRQEGRVVLAHLAQWQMSFHPFPGPQKSPLFFHRWRCCATLFLSRHLPPPRPSPFLVQAQKCLVVCGTLHSLFGGHLPTSTVVMTVSR